MSEQFDTQRAAEATKKAIADYEWRNSPAGKMADMMSDCMAPIRFYFRTHHQQPNPDLSGDRDPLFYDVLNVEFGLGRREAGDLALNQINELLIASHRLKTAKTEKERQSILVEIRDVRDALERMPKAQLDYLGATTMLKALTSFPRPESVHQLDHSEAATPPAAPRENEQAAAVDASRNKAPATNTARPPRGSLDERAVIELKRYPAATYDQLAAALGFGCRPSTLRDKAKCPMLAQAKAIIKAERETFQGNSTWRDRRPGDDDA